MEDLQYLAAWVKEQLEDEGDDEEVMEEENTSRVDESLTEGTTTKERAFTNAERKELQATPSARTSLNWCA